MSTIVAQQEEWDMEIKPQDSVFNLHLADVWAYRDLLWLLVRRDFVSFYKQTIFGPIWFFLQPVFTTITFTFIFGKLANIGTNGIPAPLFYLAGTTAWNYFSDTLTKTSTVFKDNAQVFGKVYFPRLIMPLSIVFSNLVKFGVQFSLFIIMLAYYLIKKDGNVHPQPSLVLFPVILAFMAILGLGLGLIITAMTTKYRDLAFLVTFGIQLLMYATPIIYPLSDPKFKNYAHIIALNPLSGLIEAFRYGFVGGTSGFPTSAFIYSVIASIVIFIVGLITFNRVEKSFVDTV